MTPRSTIWMVFVMGAALGPLAACGAEAPDRTPEAFDEVSAALSTGSGLRGDYFNNQSLTAPATLTRTDGTVNFNWGNGSPGTGLGVDHFSVRWTGQVEALFGQTYTFFTTSDDGVRLWVNGQQVINNWTDHGPTENSGTIALAAGQKYDLRLEFYENGGGATSRLSWSSASQPKQIIPTAQLYPPPTGGARSSCSSPLPSSAQPADVSQPTTVVGTGSAASCNFAALNAAVTRDKATINAELHPNASLAGWKRQQIIDGAVEYADRFGLQSATITASMAATASRKFAVTFSGSAIHAVNSIHRRMQFASLVSHLMVTPAHAAVVEPFLADLRACAASLASGEPAPDGSAAMYGMLGAIPDRKEADDFIRQFMDAIYE